MHACGVCTFVKGVVMLSLTRTWNMIHIKLVALHNTNSCHLGLQLSGRVCNVCSGLNCGRSFDDCCYLWAWPFLFNPNCVSFHPIPTTQLPYMEISQSPVAWVLKLGVAQVPLHEESLENLSVTWNFWVAGLFHARFYGTVERFYGTVVCG